MNTKKFRTFEIIGVPIIYLIASVLHFVYDLSNGSVLAILFSAVNESVWEHLKIFAVGYTAWSIIELLWLKPPFKKFLCAKVLGLYFLTISIAVFFYAYNLFTTSPILWLDLLSSFIFTALSQYLSYSIVMSENTIADYFPVALMLLMLYYLMFFSFTLFPPSFPLFKDPVTGMYGIIEEYIDRGAVFLTKS